MKRLQSFFLITLYLATSPLYAEYPKFNIGKEIAQCVLSPNGKFLVSTNYKLDTVKIWNIESEKLHSTFKKNNGPLFFSSDSTILFALSYKKIKSFIITQEGILKLRTLEHKNVNLDSGIRKYYTYESEICFTKLKTSQNYRSGLFISKFFSIESHHSEELTRDKIDFYVQSEELTRDKIGFYVQSANACTMTPDAFLAALACTKGAYGYPYIHVVDLVTSQTMHNYRLQCDISSISFSPDKTKLIFNASKIEESLPVRWFVVIDLITNTSSWFKQEKDIKYVAFVNDKTILWVLRDGTVSSFELTKENFSSNCLPDPEIFKVVERAQDCH